MTRLSNPTIAYKKISDYIQHVMQPQANFQRVMLSRLIVEQLNSPPGKIMLCSKKRIDSDILNENPEKPKDFVSNDVYSILVDKHKIVSRHAKGLPVSDLDKKFTETMKEHNVRCNDTEIDPQIPEPKKTIEWKIENFDICFLLDTIEHLVDPNFC